MRGTDSKQEEKFTYVWDNVRCVVAHFETLYSPNGRPSITSEIPIQGLLHQALYTIRWFHGKSIGNAFIVNV